MNIFILDTNPVLAAQMQCDKHVVKMVLESAQILSTINGGPYKPTHKNHPCVLWVSASPANYQWLSRHAIALCVEYTVRYGKRHKCQDIIVDLAISDAYDNDEKVSFVQCMPDEYKGDDPVEAYRRYYRGAKAHFATWTNRDKPTWWEN